MGIKEVITISGEEFINVIRFVVDILAIVGVTVEVIPIKVSPLKWIGKRINAETNKKVEEANKKIDTIQTQVNRIEYENDMKDLRNVKSRIHQYGRALLNGEIFSYEVFKSMFDDLDVYDSYKEKYKYMEINGKKIKINGEIENDRAIINEAFRKINKKK